jgi:polysaccharide deacetylase family protein (PEP-CTERM system associated)
MTLPTDNVFSVDVEDYFHVQAFADRIRRRDWDEFESRVVDNTRKVLYLLDRHQTRGMFFVLGWVTDRHPELVREIQREGHEIGCHSFWHRLVYEQTPEEFRDDLRLATDVLQQVTGEPVIAYRAPSFSITERSLWALDVLIDEGYRIDSSIYPVRHDTYGMPNLNPAPHVITRPTGRIIEFPPAVRRKWWFNIPVAGGGYFRLLPWRLSLHWLKNVNRKEDRPVMFYIHPWELDPAQPRLPASRKSRFRHYQNLHTTEPKLERLLETMEFQPLNGLLRRFDIPGPAKSRPKSLTDTVQNLDATQLNIDFRNIQAVDETSHRPAEVAD